MIREGSEQKLRKLITIRSIKKRNQLRKKFKRLDSNIPTLINHSDECGIAKGRVTVNNDFACFKSECSDFGCLVSRDINVFFRETLVVSLIFCIMT